MKRAIKSYWAFTNKIYRLVSLVLVPLLAVVAVVIVGQIDVEFMSLTMIIYYILFMMLEPLSDYWFLGGIYSKNKAAWGFMQGSNHFADMMKDVVVVDMIRRVLVNAFLFLVMVCVGIMDKIEPEGYVLLVFFPLLEIFFGEVTVLIGRHFEMWNHHYAVVLFGYMLVMPLMAGCIILAENVSGIICAALALLAIGMAVVTVVYTKKKVRDSYYD